MKRNKLWRRQQGQKKLERMLKAIRTNSWKDDPEWIEHFKQRAEKTRVRCSCYMCGHKREVEGRTRQEKRSDEDILEDS